MGRLRPLRPRPDVVAAPQDFSGPLLANPQFRRIFLARTKEILERVYTPEVYFPLIDATADRLREDVTLRHGRAEKTLGLPGCPSPTTWNS